MKPDSALLRRESARLIATLTRAFGPGHLAMAEDIVQETLAKAFEVWCFEGVPEHYAALLTTAAKNRALDVFRRERTARKFAPELSRLIDDEWMQETRIAGIDELCGPAALRDDQLRMMFSCCSPQLGEEVQIALILKMLSGFGVAEIASAFLASSAAIEKRLSRGKKVLAKSKQLFELSADDFAARLQTVQHALYLLFNEGYHAASAEAVVRLDLCREALRLVYLLVEHPPSATPATHALGALMCLNAARLPSRVDGAGNLTVLFEQERSRWDSSLIAEGLRLLDASATGDELTAYHVEAGIAAAHATAARAEDTPWAQIVALYDVLMKIAPSPVVALNRAMAIAQQLGPASGLEALGAIAGVERLARYPFYPAALGVLELRSGRVQAALAHFRAAHQLARNDGERRFLAQRIAECEQLLPG